MTNVVCYEPKEVKTEEFVAKDVVGRNFSSEKTAFIGDDGVCGKRSKLWLVSRSVVFDAEKPQAIYREGRKFTNVRWVNIKIYVDDDGC